MIIFRTENAPKIIFWSNDHQTDEQIIEAVTPAIRRAGTSLTTVTARKKFLSDYKRAKLEIIAKCPDLKGYEVVESDQRPSDDLSLAAWLIKNQTRAMASERQTFMDFQAPVEFEALLVPKSFL